MVNMENRVTITPALTLFPTACGSYQNVKKGKPSVKKEYKYLKNIFHIFVLNEVSGYHIQFVHDPTYHGSLP